MARSSSEHRVSKPQLVRIFKSRENPNPQKNLLPRCFHKEQARGQFENENMQPHNGRARQLQRLMQEDAVGLRTCRVAEAMCPLEFDLVSSATKLQHGELEACLDLIEETSGDDYRASSVGWDPKEKKAEMLDKDMIYLLIRQGTVEASLGMQSNRVDGSLDSSLPVSQGVQRHVIKCESRNSIDFKLPEDLGHAHASSPESSAPQSARPILGFISFMFTYDDPPNQDRQVVYIYEVHLNAGLRGYGLGSKLIDFVEKAARSGGISKTMLTVFTSNKGARLLYERLGYAKDDCSPKDRVMRSKTVEAEYKIMSKVVQCNL